MKDEVDSMCKIGVMQPYFVPYIGYWQLMNAVDTYVIFDDVNYIKRGWINRNRILINGEPHFFSLELVNASQNKKINEIEVLFNYEHRLKMMRTLELSYRKAPYYEKTMEVVEKIIMEKEKQLSLFLYNQIQILAKYFEMSTSFILSSNVKKNNDYRGEMKILDICHCLEGTQYYNAIGGVELYSREHFLKENISLFFLETNDIVYKQFSNEFCQNLSIIDVMMFNSKEKIKDMLGMYTLK